MFNHPSLRDKVNLPSGLGSTEIYININIFQLQTGKYKQGQARKSKNETCTVTR
jgi:hypothetical protein